jgi:AraC-like DNA-binding protein
MVAAAEQVRAWRPTVPGVSEVLHAHFTEHVYPMHAHEQWTLLIVDDGAVRFDLERHEHGTVADVVTLLPPHVPHNGHAATPHGFHKRVLYLDPGRIGTELIGRAVDSPGFADAGLRRQVDRAHQALLLPGDEFEAESRLALVCARLAEHLRGTVPPPRPPRDRQLAHELRELLDARAVDGLSLDEAAGLLFRHPTHLVRAFSREFGMPPHQYLTSLRVDRARRLLLTGMPVGQAAAEAGFFDQSHLTRHFRKVLGVPPGRFRTAAAPPRTRSLSR